MPSNSCFNRGASWIHGTENSPLLQLAKATDAKLAYVGDSTCVYDPHGKQLSQQRIDSAIDAMLNITSKAFQYSNAENATIQPGTSLRDFFEQQLASSVADDRELIMSLAEIWGFFIGAPWEKQSLKWFWLEECLDGGEYSRCIKQITPYLVKANIPLQKITSSLPGATKPSLTS